MTVRSKRERAEGSLLVLLDDDDDEDPDEDEEEGKSILRMNRAHRSL